MSETKTKTETKRKPPIPSFRPIFDLMKFQETLADRLAESSEHYANVHRTKQGFVPGNETAKLRARLVMEEAGELRNALMFEGKEQVLKESMDLLYVTFAILAIYDIPFTEAWNAVHANNMAKIEKGIISDGKLVKPRTHPKVDLSEYV